MTDERLLGRWLLINDEQETRIAEFLAGGHLVYHVDLLDRQLTLELEFRIEGAFLITTNPAEPAEVRALYELVGDELVMEYGEERFRYRRLVDE